MIAIPRFGPTSRGAASLLLALGLALCVVPQARAVDGMMVSTDTYYETVTAGTSIQALESTESAFPTSLYIDPGSGTLRYTAEEKGNDLAWEVRLSGVVRRHEKVDAVYNVILVLPLPVGHKGLERSIQPNEGSEAASVPLIYGGEKVALKRNVALEKSLLPGLVGPGTGQLPALDGTGYAYTLWDTIARLDPGRGDALQGWASFRYTTELDVLAPVAGDAQVGGYLISWIPTLDASVPPFAVRFEVTD